MVPRLTAAVTDGGARLPVGPDVWQETCVELPPEFPAAVYTNVFTGATVKATANDGRRLLVGNLLAELPVALMDAGP